MSDEVAFSVIDGNVKQLLEAYLSDIGFSERQDLQCWIDDYPEIRGPDLLIVTTEFDTWEFGAGRIRDRLDMLFLDLRGSLIVAELKRGEAPDTVDLQALKYAAYCSQLTVTDIVGDYARYYDTDEPTAREALFEHSPSLEPVGLGPVKVRLVAEAVKPSVTRPQPASPLPPVPDAGPAIVCLFALLHDSMRFNDNHDPLHGPRGAAQARELRADAFDLKDTEMERLEFACQEHTNGGVSLDPMVGVCWDADRLNLWGVGIRPDPRWLSTEAARSGNASAGLATCSGSAVPGRSCVRASNCAESDRPIL